MIESDGMSAPSSALANVIVFRCQRRHKVAEGHISFEGLIWIFPVAVMAIELNRDLDQYVQAVPSLILVAQPQVASICA
jgi:hypothetical protein